MGVESISILEAPIGAEFADPVCGTLVWVRLNKRYRVVEFCTSKLGLNYCLPDTSFDFLVPEEEESEKSP